MSAANEVYWAMVPMEFLVGYTRAVGAELTRRETRDAIEDCHDFFVANNNRLREIVDDHYTWRHAGVDFWRSRNGQNGFPSVWLHAAAMSFGRQQVEGGSNDE